MRTRWLRLIALLLGCLVGPYTNLLPSLALAAVVSGLALALPALVSVFVDPAITHRISAFLWIGVPVLLIGGVLASGTFYPDVWQGAPDQAAGYALVAEALLAPFFVSFAVVAASPRAGARRPPNEEAIILAMFAWLGIGVHNLLLIYLLPIAWSLISSPPIHDSGVGGGYSVVIFVVIAVIVVCLYAVGFAFASLEGLLVGTLRKRLTRPDTTNTPTQPS